MSKLDPNLQKLRDGLSAIALAVETIAAQKTKIEILDRELSGNKIHGGLITQFKSTGIEDTSSKPIMHVSDIGLRVNTIHTRSLIGDVKVNGSLTVEGEITADKLHVKEITADVRNERSTPLEFIADEKGVYGKGIYWKGDGATKQLIYRANPDRIWSSESIDIAEGQSYKIANTDILTQSTLGSSVRTSSLTKVGTLAGLRTQGDLVIDDYIFYNSSVDSLGIGTENPNGKLSIATLDAELIFDIDHGYTKIGNWTTTDLCIVTDDTTRITVKANGTTEFSSKVLVNSQLGVGVKNIDADVSLATAGPIKVQNKKFQIGSSIPTTGSYLKGDIVWNENPQPTGYVGWICVREGYPGEWKPFGQISK